MRHFVVFFIFTLIPAASLAEEKPARVDQSGDALPPGALARLGTVRFRHPDWVRSLAVSPDGKTLASGGELWIRLWEMPSGRPLKKYPRYRDKSDDDYERASTVAFTAKGDLVALGFCNNGSVFYEPHTGKELRRFKEISLDVISANGDFAVLWKNRSTIWNMTSGKKGREVPEFGSRSAALSADGKILAICESTDIRRMETGTGKELPTIRSLLQKHSPAFSPDGKTLAAVSVSYVRDYIFQNTRSDIVLWDIESGKYLRKLKTYHRFVDPMAFSADGKLLAFGIGDETHAGGKTIVLLETSTGNELERPTGHEAAVYSVAFVTGTNTIVSACEHDTIRTWDARTGKQLSESKLPSRFTYTTLSPDGKLAAWRSGDRTNLRDLTADKDVRKLDFRGAFCSVFSSDGKYLAAWGEGDGENIFRLWDTTTGKELRDCRTTGGWQAIAFSPDSKFLAREISTKHTDLRLQIIELPTGKEVRSISVKASGLVGALAYSPDGKFLASSDHDQWIQLWDLTRAEARSLWLVEHPARDRGPRTKMSFACPIAFSPDGKLLASGGDDHTVRLWDVATGKEIRKFTGHEGTIRSLKFSADGKKLASASDDTTVLIWEVAGK